MTSPPADQPHLDHAEWSRLIDRLETPVILVVLSSWMGDVLRGHCTPEDIWQDTLAMAWRDRSSHRWSNLRAFRAWLLGIAKHRIHDTLDRMNAQKRNRGRQPTSLEADRERLGPDHDPPRTTTPSRLASAQERADILREALEALPEKYRDVVRLRLMEELTMREVAERVGIGLTTANERFFRGSELYQLELERRLGPSVRGRR